MFNEELPDDIRVIALLELLEIGDISRSLMENEPVFWLSLAQNNWLLFCANTPVAFVDPLGLRWVGGGDDGEWTVGRPGTIVSTGPDGFGATLETYFPAMETMSIIHDAVVDALVPDIPVFGEIVDVVVNIPTMPVAYGVAVVYETGKSIGNMIGGIVDFFKGDNDGGAKCD